jgi:hypothetical protein
MSSFKCSSSSSPWPWKIAERRPRAAGLLEWALTADSYCA